MLCEQIELYMFTNFYLYVFTVIVHYPNNTRYNIILHSEGLLTSMKQVILYYTYALTYAQHLLLTFLLKKI